MLGATRCYLENREIGLVDATLTSPPQNREGPPRRLISILYTHRGFFCPKILTSRHHLTPQQLRARRKKCPDQLFDDVFFTLVHPSSTGGSRTPVSSFKHPSSSWRRLSCFPEWMTAKGVNMTRLSNMDLASQTCGGRSRNVSHALTTNRSCFSSLGSCLRGGQHLQAPPVVPISDAFP